MRIQKESIKLMFNRNGKSLTQMVTNGLKICSICLEIDNNEISHPIRYQNTSTKFKLNFILSHFEFDSSFIRF